MKLFLIVIACFAVLHGYEEPPYKVHTCDDCIEVREYPSIIIAEVQVKGPRKEALKSGFRVIADYIFGNNSSKAKITMTAPVMQQSNELPSCEAAEMLKKDTWLVRFVLPQEYTLETAPKPQNAKISLRIVPARKVAVIRFSGRTGDDHVIPQLEKLNNFLAERRIMANGAPIFAYYNPPWTLPFLRRNEIMISIKD